MKWFLLILLLASCGARKTVVHKQESEKKQEVSLDIKNDIQETVNTDIVITADAVTWTIVPVDNTKPSSVTSPDGKTYTLNNAKAEIKKETSQTEIKQKADKKDNSWVNVKSQTDENQSSFEKRKESEGFKFPWWLWLVLAGIIYGVLKYFKIV